MTKVYNRWYNFYFKFWGPYWYFKSYWARAIQIRENRIKVSYKIYSNMIMKKNVFTFSAMFFMNRSLISKHSRMLVILGQISPLRLTIIRHNIIFSTLPNLARNSIFFIYFSILDTIRMIVTLNNITSHVD